MKKFGSRLLLFFSVLTVVFLLFFFINSWIIRSFPYKLDKKTKVLIIGDSHLQTSLNPQIIPNSYNVCISAETYNITYLKLKYLLEHNPNIQKVLLGFSYHNFSAFNDLKFITGNTSKYIFDTYYGLPILEVLDSLEYNKTNYLTALAFNNALPNATAINLLLRIKEPLYIGGFGSIDKSNIYKKAILDTTINRHYYNNKINVGISKFAEKYLNAIINLCKKSKIKLYLIATPLHSAYYDKIPDNFKQNFHRIKKEIQSGSATHLLDMTDKLKADSLFLDFDHLNKDGSKIFSNIIKKQIED